MKNDTQIKKLKAEEVKGFKKDEDLVEAPREDSASAATRNTSAKGQSSDLSNINGSNNKGTRRRSKKKRRTDPKNGVTTTSVTTKRNNSSDVTQVSDGKTGTKASAANFIRDDKAVNGETNAEPSGQAKFLSTQDLRKHSSVKDKVVSYQAYNNVLINISLLNSRAVQLGITKNQELNANRINKIQKQMDVLSAQTVSLGIQREVYDEVRPVTEYYWLDLVREKKRNLPIAIFPQVISFGMNLNISGALSDVITFFVDDIKNEGQTFTYKERSNVAQLSFWEAEKNFDVYKLKHISDNPKVDINLKVKNTQTRAAFIDGEAPDYTGLTKPDKLVYTPKPVEIKYNLVNGDIDDSFRNDIGTRRKAASSRQFLSNVENIVQTIQEFFKFAGFSRNTRVFMHIHATLVQFGTYMRIIYSSIKHSIEAAPFITEKLGYTDVTLKHLINGPRRQKIQAALQIWAGWISLLPYDDYVLQTFEKRGEVGTLNSSDPYGMYNPLIVPVFNFVGDFLKDSGWGNKIAFRDNDAAPAIVIEFGNLLTEFLSDLIRWFKFENVCYRAQNYGMNNQPMLLGVTDGDNKESATKVIANVSKRRITSHVYDVVNSMSVLLDQNTKFEEYFRSMSAFLQIYQAPGIFDGTDWKINEVEVPDLGLVKPFKPNKFYDTKLLSGMNLGTEFAQVPILSKKELELGNRMPSWRLFIEHGSDRVRYSNLIGFIWAETRFFFSKEKSKYNYVSEGFFDGVININTNLKSINILDSTIIPIFSFSEAIVCGWNHGTTMKGEVYNFKVLKDDFVQFMPTMFEWSTGFSNAMKMINESVNTSFPANHPAFGYWVSHTMLCGLSMSESRNGIISALYKENDWNLLPVNYWLHKDNKFFEVGMNPNHVLWTVDVPQLFRFSIFKGLSPLAHGVASDSLHTLEDCDLSRVD